MPALDNIWLQQSMSQFIACCDFSEILCYNSQ